MGKKNRAKTEERILQATLRLIESAGFSDFGVNTVSREAGCDKVLLYRYFAGADGILGHLAEATQCIEEAGMVPSAFPQPLPDPRRSIIEAPRKWVQNILANPLLYQLNRWRQVSRNPLTERYRAVNESCWRSYRQALQPYIPPKMRGTVGEALEILDPYASRAAMSSVPRHLLLAIEVHLDRMLPQWEAKDVGKGPTRPLLAEEQDDGELPSSLL